MILEVLMYLLYVVCKQFIKDSWINSEYEISLLNKEKIWTPTATSLGVLYQWFKKIGWKFISASTDALICCLFVFFYTFLQFTEMEQRGIVPFFMGCVMAILSWIPCTIIIFIFSLCISKWIHYKFPQIEEAYLYITKLRTVLFNYRNLLCSLR